MSVISPPFRYKAVYGHITERGWPIRHMCGIHSIIFTEFNEDWMDLSNLQMKNGASGNFLRPRPYNWSNRGRL